MLITSLRRPENQAYIGKRLDEIALMKKSDYLDAAMDLILTEHSRVETTYFLMNEENVKLQLQQPWMKIGSDAGGPDPDSVRALVHPRTFGNFPRILGKYVRDEHVIPLEDAIRKMTSAVATRLSIPDRGLLKPGMFADIVVFDPATIADRATFEQPKQLSVGVRHVWVNGVQVLRDGAHTGAKPGRAVRGPGYRPTREVGGLRLSERRLDPVEEELLEAARRAARNAIGAAAGHVLTHRNERRLDRRAALAVGDHHRQQRDVDPVGGRLGSGHARSAVDELGHRPAADLARLEEVRIADLARRRILDGERNVEIDVDLLHGEPDGRRRRGDRSRRGERSFAEQRSRFRAREDRPAGATCSRPAGRSPRSRSRRAQSREMRGAFGAPSEDC